MTKSLQLFLERRGWLLADGATGTNLFNMGLQSGDAPELWNHRHPDRIRALYQGSVNAGADVFLTNSFGGNAARLKLHDAQSRVAELCRLSAELGREVADGAGRDVFVAGSIGPTGEILAPLGGLSHDVAIEIFEEQGAALLEGGVDLLWIETMSALDELSAAVEAVTRLGAPWIATMSFDMNGRTMMGVTEAEFLDCLGTLDHHPVAMGANCGLGVSDMLRTILGFVEHGHGRPLVAKANAGIPKFRGGKIRYDSSLETMARYALLARDCGASIIGGCCGTTPTHLEAMRVALDESPRRETPSLETISDQLGAFSVLAPEKEFRRAGGFRRRRGREGSRKA